VGDHDAPFQHHLLDLAEAEREPVVEPDTVAGDLRWEAKPLVGRRTDGHQTSSSQKQAVDHPSHPDREVDGAVSRSRAAGVALSLRLLFSRSTVAALAYVAAEPDASVGKF
jgi:hypothetical protein